MVNNRQTKNAAVPQEKSDETRSWPLIKRLVTSYLTPHMGLMMRSFIFMAIAAAATAAIAQLMQPILDDLLVEGNVDLIFPVCGAVFLAFTVRGLATYVHTVMTTKVGQGVIADIQNQLFEHFMDLDLAFFHANPSGQLIARVINDVNVVRTAVTDSLTGIGKSTLTLLFLIGVMMYQDWQLTLASFIILPFAAGFVAYLGRRLRKISKNIQAEIGDLTAVLSQIFQGIRQVKAFNMEGYESARAGQAIETVKRLNIKSVRVGSLSTPVNEIMVGALLFGIIAYGGYKAAAGEMTAGELGAFLTAFTMAYEPMKKLARLNNNLQMGLGGAERIFAMMDTQSAIMERDAPKTLESKKPKITFKDVSFSYPGEEEEALSKTSFELKAGKVTALVGPSGSGKSTIMNLIPRFYDPSEGQILIGKDDIKDLSFQSLRSHIALVSQDITIFDDSVMDNIRYGRAGASDEDVRDAARLAFAHDFIEHLSDGYDTVLGEDGVKLSGGQRQRIAIARAILRNAPILLLDEATSALDNESEAAIQHALEKLQKGRTTLVIAHRLSTVQNADQILVLDQGQIIESGQHDDLIAQNGLYAKMYNIGLKAT